jgi:hypothetical protein
MGAFAWLMKKVSKVFSRSTNALFYITLYREILNEIQEITKDEVKTVEVLREIGKQGALESCERHSGIFRFMPGNPRKVLEYFGILWSVVFGMEMGEHEYEEIPQEDAQFNDFILKIKQCPICAGLGDDEEDTFDFSKVDKEKEGMACGLCGMLEAVANFILKIKKSEFRISIVEQKCMARGEESLHFICKTHYISDWNKLLAERGQSILEEEFPSDEKLDIFDKIQDYFTLDKLEEILDEPLEKLKNRTADFIRDKLNMEPDHFFDYFRNYEDDMLRILGFVGVHLLNEYGGLVEKFLKSETFAKVAGYIFKHLKEMSLLFIPIDVINDYHELLISFLDGLAPPEMVDNVRKFTGKDDIAFVLEGAQIALENLGIDFSKLKDNIWEELKKEREDELVPAEPTVIDQTQEKFPKFVKIIQEMLMLINEILTLPIRVIISESHYGLKTAVDSVTSEEEGLFGSIKERFDTIFDYIQELRQS